MDDDIAYNVYELLHLLQATPDVRYLGGNAFRTSRPYRGDSKWRVTVEEWPREFYPPYVSGRCGATSSWYTISVNWRLYKRKSWLL